MCLLCMRRHQVGVEVCSVLKSTGVDDILRYIFCMYTEICVCSRGNLSSVYGAYLGKMYVELLSLEEYFTNKLIISAARSHYIFTGPYHSLLLWIQKCHNHRLRSSPFDPLQITLERTAKAK
jgi:hypothetical protein